MLHILPSLSLLQKKIWPRDTDLPKQTATTYRNTTKNNQNNLLHKKGMMIDRSRVDNARQRCDAVLHCITHSTRTSFISPTALSGLPVVIWRGAKIPCTIYYYIIYICIRARSMHRYSLFFLYYIVEVVL